MIIYRDIKVKNQKVKTETHVCPHHKKHPEDVSYPGCSCSSSWSLEFDTEEGEERELCI